MCRRKAVRQIEKKVTGERRDARTGAFRCLCAAVRKYSLKSRKGELSGCFSGDGSSFGGAD